MFTRSLLSLGAVKNPHYLKVDLNKNALLDDLSVVTVLCRQEFLIKRQKEHFVWGQTGSNSRQR